MKDYKALAIERIANHRELERGLSRGKSGGRAVNFNTDPSRAYGSGIDYREDAMDVLDLKRKNTVSDGALAYAYTNGVNYQEIVRNNLKEERKLSREEWDARAKSVKNTADFAYNAALKPTGKAIAWTAGKAVKGIKAIGKAPVNGFNKLVDRSVAADMYEQLDPDAIFEKEIHGGRPLGAVATGLGNILGRQVTMGRNARMYNKLEEQAEKATAMTGQVITPEQIYALSSPHRVQRVIVDDPTVEDVVEDDVVDITLEEEVKDSNQMYFPFILEDISAKDKEGHEISFNRKQWKDLQNFSKLDYGSLSRKDIKEINKTLDESYSLKERDLELSRSTQNPNSIPKSLVNLYSDTENLEVIPFSYVSNEFDDFFEDYPDSEEERKELVEDQSVGDTMDGSREMRELEILLGAEQSFEDSGDFSAMDELIVDVSTPISENDFKLKDNSNALYMLDALETHVDASDIQAAEVFSKVVDRNYSILPQGSTVENIEADFKKYMAGKEKPAEDSVKKNQ